MPYTTNDLNMLKGNTFSNGYKLHIQNELHTDRITFLENVVEGKKIIHVGFCDHIPLLEKKISNNTWVHARLVNKSKKCIGVDTDKSAVNIIREKYNIDNIFAVDIINEMFDEISTDQWDYILLGEILEHVDNPVDFLNQIKKRYGKYIREIIITVPNALRYENYTYGLKNIEFINSDHRYWFTPYTISKVMFQADISPSAYYLLSNNIQNFPKNPKYWKAYMIKKKKPLFRENLVAIGTL